MKISIITVCYNSAKTVRDTVESVLGQTHADVEYIIIDGASKDSTLAVLGPYRDRFAHLVSEPDKGIYDAMNKGLALATGDVVGLLNSDDVYAHKDVLAHVARCFDKNAVDTVYGDLNYVAEDDLERVVRRWQSSPYSPGLFRRGWHPPHPSFFVRKEVYGRYGCFNTRFRIAADFELMLRLLERHRVTSAYLQEVLVLMRTGGASNRSINNIIRANQECWEAWKVNGLSVNPWTILRKPLSKIGQILKARGL